MIKQQQQQQQHNKLCLFWVVTNSKIDDSTIYHKNLLLLKWFECVIAYDYDDHWFHIRLLCIQYHFKFDGVPHGM